MGKVTYQAQYRRCSKLTCHCATGQPHGPYYYAFWREGDKLKSRYCGKEMPADFAPSRAYERRPPKPAKPKKEQPIMQQAQPTSQEPGKRETILRFIYNYRRQHGWSPSYREIMEAVGITNPGHVHYYIEHLVEERLLYKQPGMARAIRLSRTGLALIGIRVGMCG